MINLLISIGCSTVIFIIFRLFTRFRVKNFQAIVMNYLVAGSIGFFLTGNPPDVDMIMKADWLPFALTVGVLFITLFNVMALSSQKVGVSITSLATKMSFVIPVALAFYLYGDPVTVLKIAGIALALVGVYLSSTRKGKLSFNPKFLYLPVLLFIGSGILDTLLNYTEKNYPVRAIMMEYTSILFLFSAIFGLVYLGFRFSVGQEKPSGRSLLGGMVLGIPNYGSIYFLLQTLSESGMNSSTVFSLNNIGIVVLSALVGKFVFRERLDAGNWIGIVLSITAIGLIGFAID